MTIYDISFFMFSIIYLPYLVVKGKAHKDFMQRFGKLSPDFKRTSLLKPVWIHAVSVGEVLAVKNFVENFQKRFPEQKIILSTTTRTGNAVAGKVLNRDVLKFYFPLDFSFVVKRVVDFINPSILIIMETEIWPNLILELSKRRLPIVLINGRISDKSFKGYRKIKFFFGKILKKINLFCMQTTESAERIKALGAAPSGVRTTGNMKFDVRELSQQEKLMPNLELSGKLIIAGSTHAGEEEIVLEVYKELLEASDSLQLLIAPRHIDRAEAIKKKLEQYGFEGILMSQIEKGARKALSKKTILILDTLGELKHLYSLATIVFMGGSLIKRGGHNIIEPAISGKPIVFGPYMFNFKDMARSFLENNAALEVKNKRALKETLQLLLKDENRRIALGRNAKGLIDKSRGATERNIDEVALLLEKR